jgi:hypothetical protein
MADCLRNTGGSLFELPANYSGPAGGGGSSERILPWPASTGP